MHPLPPVALPPHGAGEVRGGEKVGLLRLPQNLGLPFFCSFSLAQVALDVISG